MVGKHRDNPLFELGLIGHQLGHSFSANFFNEKFKREHINGHYSLFPLESINDLPKLLSTREHIVGLNVTMPYKQQVIRFIDECSEEVESIGAVNTIGLRKDRVDHYKLFGYNTDWIGFKESLRPLLNENVSKALILGTGGASKAVQYALNQLGIESTKVSRYPSKCVSGKTITYEDITEYVIRTHSLIINTTPLGMYPNIDTAPPIPYNFLTSFNICYDLVYNPEITMFMKLSEANHAIIKNGLEMLHLQAKAAWNIWQMNGFIP